MGKRTCSVGGCDRPHDARGFCHYHYLQDWKERRAEHPLDMASVAERFWSKVEKHDPDCPCCQGCWIWRASTKGNGYGKLWCGHRMELAHRVSYMLLVGSIPDGLELDHLCRNTRCVNPNHLEPVTRRENILRGESPFAKNARKTHCKRGHSLTPDNVYIDSKTGYRKCRTCTLAAMATPERKAKRNARLRQRARELGHWPQ